MGIEHLARDDSVGKMEVTNLTPLDVTDLDVALEMVWLVPCCTIPNHPCEVVVFDAPLGPADASR